MSQHWKSLLVVLVIIGAIVFFYRGEKTPHTSAHIEPEKTHTVTEKTTENHSTNPTAVHETVPTAVHETAPTH